MEPALKHSDISFYTVDALSGAQLLEDNSVNCVVTSPPYFRLRQYLPDGHPRRHLEIGAEEDPQAYVDKLVAVFEALKPALRDDGTMWVVVGSSYAGSWGARGRGEHTNAPRPDLEAKYGTAAPALHKQEPKMALRQDLTTEQEAYVLSELARARSISADTQEGCP